MIDWVLQPFLTAFTFHVAMAMAPIKGVRKWHFLKKYFSQFWIQEWNQQLLISNLTKFCKVSSTNYCDTAFLIWVLFDENTQISTWWRNYLWRQWRFFSKFCLACAIGLSWDTLVPNFATIRQLLHVIHSFFMYVFCIFPQNDRGFSKMTWLSMTSQ